MCRRQIYDQPVLRIVTEQLEVLYTPSEAKTMAQMLLCSITGLTLPQLVVQPEMHLPDVQSAAVEAAVKRLLDGEPVQYVIGYADFYGRRFEVDRRALIPRPETEELVHRIVSDFKGKRGMAVLDIGTGSGCIAISLAKELSAGKVVAVDIAGETIDLARTNAGKLHAGVSFVCSDVLEWTVSRQPDRLPEEVSGKFDVIVSNPPYVCKSEQSGMEANVLAFEPHRALFVDDGDPLLFYRTIGRYALSHLTDGGCLYFEINQRFGQETCRLLRTLGFRQVTLFQDINSNPRIIKASEAS